MDILAGDLGRPIGNKHAPSHRTLIPCWLCARNPPFFEPLEICASIRKNNNRVVLHFCILKNPTPSATLPVGHFCISFVLLFSSWTHFFGTTLNHFSASALVASPL